MAFIVFLLYFINQVFSHNCTVCLSLINALRTSTIPDQTIADLCPDEDCTVFFISRLDDLIVAIHRDNEDRDICMSLNFCIGESEEQSLHNIGKLQCGVCVAALEHIWARSSIDVSSRDVIQILNEVCPKYPSSEDFCKSLQLKGSVSRIIEGILTNKTPHYTFSQLNLCNSPESTLVPNSNSNSIEKFSQQPSKLRCSICKGLYLLALTYYESTDDISQIQQQLSSICHTVPPSLRGLCDELLQYRSVFEIAITSGADSFTACQMVYFCPESGEYGITFTEKTSYSQLNAAVSIPSLECQACQWGISAVEAYLSQDQNVEDLGLILAALCTVLPAPYDQTCKDFITLYLDEAMLVVLDTFTPPAVCTRLGICNQVVT